MRTRETMKCSNCDNEVDATFCTNCDATMCEECCWDIIRDKIEKHDQNS